MIPFARLIIFLLGATAMMASAGIEAGIYVVSKLKYFPRHAEAAVSDLPDGVIVLQTCVTKTQMVFIALTTYKVVG